MISTRVTACGRARSLVDRVAARGAAATSRFCMASRGRSRAAGSAGCARRGDCRRRCRSSRSPRSSTRSARLRDRFLFALLFGTRDADRPGARAAPRDFVSHERRIEIVAREDNANGARGKGGEGSVPIAGELVRCTRTTCTSEYGDLDSDYVFVNLWGGRVGRAMRYANVVDDGRAARAAGSAFTSRAHMFRHTYATLARRGGVPMEIVSKLLTHSSLQTTSDIYCTPRRRICAPSSSAPA